MSASILLFSMQQLFQIGGPILLFIGTTSCILNLLVLKKISLRKSPCTMCLVGVNIINFADLFIAFLFTFLIVGYDIDPSSKNIVLCRVRYYMSYILPCCEASCLILASIDRVLVTSPNAGTRRRSTRRLTIINIIIVCSFWAVFHIHALIFTQIVQYGTNYFVCIYQPGDYTTFITYYSVVVNGCLPPALMIIFGCWTVKNVRQIRRVTHNSSTRGTASVVIGTQHTFQSKDQQLIRMLFIDILSYIICKYPVTIMQIYQQVTKYDVKSDERQQIEQAVLELTTFFYFVENSIGCYTNIFASKAFRAELKRILLKIVHYFRFR
ncbi:unnamed protein product [Adineta steineri]|uniref:G-protein coupled receptors family 1 profile domain-containing protein n=1 Tax=Adineta steineri TaxID=433720 RepID=A0A814G4U1_9BILA|nr:unnamed protein product [Adineta steineri]CAF0855500.1 unnamed protein product [Adineta steineri]CAF0992858.1 unnamed protein product [Adineta steineri]CAF4203464.1 unnamed protein product [Adineta steineri]CAF4230191.1 unnamed protein product [Adineta steineri]